MSVYLDSSALAKLLRPEQEHEIARAAFEGAAAPATSAISYPELALRHRLRGMDEIHVASALEIAGESRETLSFVSWDRDQREAARKEGLALMPEEM